MITVIPGLLPPKALAHLRERLRGKAGVFITGTERISAELLDACPELRAVCTMTVGYNHIDVAACAQRGIVVTNTPEVLTEATAEIVIGRGPKPADIHAFDARDVIDHLRAGIVTPR